MEVEVKAGAKSKGQTVPTKFFPILVDLGEDPDMEDNSTTLQNQ